MSRIEAKFAALKREGRGALIPFLEAYDPDPATSMAILHGMPGAGADLIEIGMPFTDPMADGPAIQAAALRALQSGQTLRKTLAIVSEFRQTNTETPIVLMGYYNPIYVYGVKAFLEDANAAGHFREGNRPLQHEHPRGTRGESRPHRLLPDHPRSLPQ